MKNYNEKERKLARHLNKHPKIKSLAKSAYSFISYLLHRKPYAINTSLPVNQVINSKQTESFFGYYDKCPESSTGLILVYTTDHSTKKKPSKDKPITVNVVDPNGNIIFQTSSFAYNWQQGCRAQWISPTSFIYNDFDRLNKCYVAKVASITSNKVELELPHPVQDSYKDEYYLSVNYQRLMKFRADYGYRNIPSDQFVDHPDKDGIWLIKYNSPEPILIVSLLRIVTEFPIASCTQRQKVNHIMISPDGNYFIFLHRYFINNVRHDRLFLSDKDGHKLTILLDNGMVSHCFWYSDREIITYAKDADDKAKYLKINISTLQVSEFDSLKNNYGDGHPHVNSQVVVTDSYPDKSRMQYLISNFKNNLTFEIVGEFFHGLEYKDECRCDLHPRLSLDGSKVYIDSVYSGQRQLYWIDLK